MNNTKYEIQNEWLGTEEATEYIFIIRDSSDIKAKLEQQEKLRAIFLVVLIEKYNYPEKDIHLDIEVNNSTIDLLVYKNEKPFIAVDVNPEEPKQTITKAQELGAEYAVIITKSNRQFFRITKTKDPISDLPKN